MGFQRNILQDNEKCPHSNFQSLEPIGKPRASNNWETVALVKVCG